MMMRGEKVMSPMFPRLHVNDTEKGGPRAPPRNKMALYEQLSIPSQRFNSGSPSMLPLPPNNNNSLVPSISSSHGGGNERSMFVPFGNTHESSILADKFHSYSIPGNNLNTTKGNQERKSAKAIDDNSLDTTQPIPAVSKSNPLQPLHFSNFKKFSLRKQGHDDDLRVPTCILSGIDQNCSCSNQSEGRGIFSKLNLSSSMRLQNANERQMKENDSVDPKSRRYVGNQEEEKGRLSQCHQNITERSDSILPTRDKILVDTASNLSTKINDSESLKRPHASYNQENKSSSVDILNGKDGPNARLHHEYVVTQDKMIFRENILVESGRCLENGSKVRNESCMRQSLAVDNGTPNALENRSKAHEEKNCEVMQVGGVNRLNNVPGDSTLESISPLDICPDDVVGIIGEKHFWKVRRVIVNQQRVFAVQVFELHRLIKVQRLIAGLPHILLEDTLYMGKPSLDVSPIKKLPADYVSEPPLIVKVKDNSQKTNISIECADENALAKLPFPSTNDNTSKGLVTHRPKYGPYSGNARTTPMAANTRASPWCFSPPGNQWLVPVMSLSEGLVYKPYTVPFPPTAGFLAPVYGSSGPVNLATGVGDFLNTVYGVPASHQQGIGILPGNPPIGQAYFPHYGMPVRNPSVSGSAVEQMASFTGVQSKGNQFSTGDVNFTIAHQSSCNMSSQMSQAISYCAGKLPASKESQILGSTASSPSERAKGDALPLFPTEPTTQASNHDAQASGQRTRVIKVVPHNPRLATESAARIFHSIQEERKQYV
ncbi:ELF3-like protein 2 [Durio zibethinus]|uniref:ELF3-like protein 2 n=1 Tax=Durio zibethinus TaxID=66656 RepID=A0A6P5WGY1_DURZI|nr:ELF3-like protein 2 [Durio zibethinus]XP_022715077.1 ELF3-like protein 2 [Durio zibethinus]